MFGVNKLSKATDKRILSGDLVAFQNKDSRAQSSRSNAQGAISGGGHDKEHQMEFLTNNLQWSAGSVADLCPF